MIPISVVCSATRVVMVLEMSTSADNKARMVDHVEELGELQELALARPVACGPLSGGGW